jgi:hypothetical protein
MKARGFEKLFRRRRREFCHVCSTKNRARTQDIDCEIKGGGS